MQPCATSKCGCDALARNRPSALRLPRRANGPATWPPRRRRASRNSSDADSAGRARTRRSAGRFCPGKSRAADPVRCEGCRARTTRVETTAPLHPFRGHGGGASIASRSADAGAQPASASPHKGAPSGSFQIESLLARYDRLGSGSRESGTVRVHGEPGIRRRRATSCHCP